ncbi:MAG: alanine--tRNA ligase [Candidatus Limnocylindrales bacterium]
MAVANTKPDPRIRSLSGDALRRRFLDFFAARGHTIVPSASLVPAGDQTLLFTNSGMVQFKDVLTGVEKRSYTRAADVQRVLRVAGKHNDFEEVGRTTRHNTFFEMLGNWSFGDYFKREAIQLAWEFLTVDLGLPAERLAATTYRDDDVAWHIWHDEIGLPPERMARWGDVDAGDDKNFWRMAETGPCGPCSEIHFDRGARFSEGDFCVPDHSETCPRWLEIWNLVFMEFDQRPAGRTPLPFTSVDTGMSLERLASVVQQVPSNFDTDLFTPLHDAMRAIVGHDPEAFEAERFSYQVIADHARAITFLIADDVRPSNEGRGYVLRRILRRAVRHGRLLGRREPFLVALSRVVVASMGDAYPHVRERQAEIESVIAAEERQFARTLDAGSQLLSGALAALTDSPRQVGRRPESLPPHTPMLAGEVAFRLHDTYGFPVDLTVELAAESGVGVDRAGFEAALAEQRQRSRKGTKAGLSQHAEAAALYQDLLARLGETEFLGYETTRAPAGVLAILVNGREVHELVAATAAEVVLDRTPFYAEGGGQIGDQGWLRKPKSGAVLFEVQDTQRPIAGLIAHRGVSRGRFIGGRPVEAEVDAERRDRTMRNHTATHLLHRALRNTVGDRARQAGSLVTPDYLRFDFPFERPLSDEELRAIEAEVHRVVREDRPVQPALMSMAEAIALGADAFFDERYGETVRTVAVEGYSRELCGGTHCRASGQVGGFHITAERSIGSGMRRIEAVTGDKADEVIADRLELLDRAAAAVGARSIEALPERAAELQGRVHELEVRLRAEARADRPRPGELAERAETVAGTRYLGAIVERDSMTDLKGHARDLRAILGPGVIALVLDNDEPQLFVTVSDDLVARGLGADSLVAAGAPHIVGKGGGRPQMAQARGTRREGGDEALSAIRAAIANALGVKAS